MIRFRLQELIADKQFREGRRITLLEVSEATGINRMTLSRMVNTRGYSTVTDNLDRLCKFFGCSVGDIAVFVPEDVEERNTSTTKRSDSGATSRGRKSRKSG